nr:mucoidy inhibitor MuiA family protein [uncultured Psychroserpens sp.]
MRLITLLLFFNSLISFAGTGKDDIKNTATTLKKVTVYLSGAQIERSANITLEKGTREFVFNKLSPNIEESSIQISGLKNASILSVNFGINYLSKQDTSSEVETIKAQIEKLNNQYISQDNIIMGYNEELYLIQQNRSLGNTTQVVSLEKLQKFSTYFRTRITEIKEKIQESTNAKNNLSAQISDLKKQLNELNVDEKVQTGEIKIKLNTEITTDLNLIIKYNVSEAGWFPIYDIKAKKINEPLQLTYKAHVYQNTGNDWNNVKLTLSTSDPNTNNIKPSIDPKYLNFISKYSNYDNSRATKSYNYKYNPLVKTVTGVVTASSDGLPLPGVSVIEKGTTNGVQTDFDGNYTIKTQNGKDLQYSFVGMQNETLPIHSSIMNVTMIEDLNDLDEVVITGYSGATSSSKIRGQAAGVNVRGSNSLNEDVEPLFIIDGLPVGQNEFSALSQSDIKDMQVIKNAQATALYGTRGAGGVVLISTKEGNFTSNGDFMEEGITNTRFEISKLHTIPNNNDVTVIEIENYEVPANYSYFSAPVLNENVFLTAEIENWEQYNLLPAEANVYFEGSYSGKTNINPQSTTEKLTISLGVDPNVVVKRTQPTNFKRNAFIGSNKIIAKNYEIEVKNNKSSAIDLVLYDRIPISQNRDIKIDDIETGNSIYDDKKGILKWTLKLDANVKETHKFSYTVKYPKYKRVNL